MFKYRLYPNKTQEATLEHQLDLCRWTYNRLLLHCRSTNKKTGKLPTLFDLNKLLVKLKTENLELEQVHSQILQNISKRIRDAYHGFFQRRKYGLKAGLPRFKKPQRYRSFTYPQSGYNIDRNRLHMSKIGDIKIRLHRPIQGLAKTLTVKKTPSGKWFACFSCIVDSNLGERPLKEVGIDLGLKFFAVLSDGTRIKNPRFYQTSERRLARLQRSYSQKERDSRNHERANLKVARLHEKIENRRSDFLHKVSRAVANAYSIVYVEDLKIRNMVRNHLLAKSISDAGWGRFVRMLCYKEEESGGRVIFVNPHNTSQICSRCSNIVTKALSDRKHECPFCGLVMDRDLNASRNILKIGRGPPESKPVERLASTLSLKVEQVNSMNQEDSLLIERQST